MRRLSALPRIDLLVIARSKSYQQDEVLDGSGNIASSAAVPQLWTAGTRRSVTGMLSLAKRIVLLRDTPWPGRDVPDCLSAHLDDPQSCAFSTGRQAHGDQQLTEAELAATANLPTVRIVDPTSLICRGRSALSSPRPG